MIASRPVCAVMCWPSKASCCRKGWSTLPLITIWPRSRSLPPGYIPTILISFPLAILLKVSVNWDCHHLSHALTPDQVRSLKDVCDRLERFHQVKGQRRKKAEATTPVQAHGRPWRDRATMYVLFSTGLRREKLIKLDLDQVEPHTPQALHSVRRARISRIKGKGKTERTVFLSADARKEYRRFAEFCDACRRYRYIGLCYGPLESAKPCPRATMRNGTFSRRNFLAIFMTTLPPKS